MATKKRKLISMRAFIFFALIAASFAADYANSVLRNAGAGCAGSIAFGASILSGSCFVSKSTCNTTHVTSEIFNNGADLFSCTGNPDFSVSIPVGCVADTVELTCGALPVQPDLIYISTFLNKENNCVGDPDVVVYVPSVCAPLVAGLVLEDSSIPAIFRKFTLNGDTLEAAFPCSDSQCTSCGSTFSFKLGDCSSASSAPGQPSLNTRYTVGFSAASSVLPAVTVLLAAFVALMS